jgi:Ran GTPase-activating protein (RanGAP) involved in mRNA processing and transport
MAKKKGKGKGKGKIKCLQNLTQVETGTQDVCDVDLVNLELGDMEMLADHIAHCPRIRDLNIHTMTKMDDAHMDQLIRRIGQADLRTACFNCHGFEPKSLKSLGKTLSKCPALRRLDLAHNILGPNGLKDMRFKLCEGLRHINLYFNKIGDPGVLDLTDMLKGGRCRSLHSLVLDYNDIGVAGAESICACLEAGDIPHLLELSLANNSLRDRGALAIANAIKKGVCITIRKFNLAHNGIELVGCRQFAEAVIAERRWHHPPHLDLTGNSFASQTVQVPSLA